MRKPPACSKRGQLRQERATRDAREVIFRRTRLASGANSSGAAPSSTALIPVSSPTISHRNGGRRPSLIPAAMVGAIRIRHAEAWWRDLAEIEFDDERSALSFLARRGDPFGELAPGKPIALFHWAPLIARLQQAASAWEPVGPVKDAFAVSAIRPREQCATAERFHISLPADWTTQLSVTYDGLVPVLRAKMLAAYCIAAAAVSLRQRRPMRRCLFCASWFTIHHAGAEFCSPSCRASAHNGRTSPHVFRSQDLHAEGSAPLASPLEHPGTRREADRKGTELRNPKGRKGLRGKDARRGRASRRRRSAPA